jgi:spoIIIJ-associated protein
MKELEQIISELVGKMGFSDYKVEAHPDGRVLTVMIYDGFITTERLPRLVTNMNKIGRLIAKRLDMGPIIIDVNNYRKERERLIIELAKAAARKAVVGKERVELPPMNSYERRLVHAELSMRPDIETESTGEGKDRRVTVFIIEE